MNISSVSTATAAAGFRGFVVWANVFLFFLFAFHVTVKSCFLCGFVFAPFSAKYGVAIQTSLSELNKDGNSSFSVILCCDRGDISTPLKAALWAPPHHLSHLSWLRNSGTMALSVVLKCAKNAATRNQVHVAPARCVKTYIILKLETLIAALLVRCTDLGRIFSSCLGSVSHFAAAATSWSGCAAQTACCWCGGDHSFLVAAAAVSLRATARPQSCIFSWASVR